MQKPVLTLIFLLLISVILYSQNKIVEYDSKTKKYGIKNKTSNKWLTLPLYENILAISQTGYNGDAEYFIARKNTKDYIISKNGTSIISPAFDKITPLNSNNNLFIVKNKGLYSFFETGSGIIKELGNFNEFDSFDSDEKYLKIRKDKSWFLFFAERKKMDSISYDLLNTQVIWKDSLFYIYAKKIKWGIINNTGTKVIPFEYDTLENSEEFYRDYIKTYKNNKWGLIDFSGKTLLENSYENIDLRVHQAFRIDFFENFIIGMRDQNFISAKKDRKWGVVDFKLKGKPIVPFIYDSIRGVNLQKKIFLVIKNGKMGGIDFYNNIIYPFTFNEIERIDANFTQETNDKLFLVNYGCTGCIPRFLPDIKYGITDSTGKIILEPDANIIKLFNKPPQNYSSQSDDSTFLGYLWNIGGELIETVVLGDTIIAQDPNTGADSIVAVFTFSYIFKGGKSGIVNRHGKYILPVTFDDFIFAFLKIDSYTGEDRGIVLNKITHPSRQTEFKNQIDTSFDIIAVKDKKYGVYNWSGKEIIPCIFDSIAFEFFSLDINDSIFKSRNYQRQFYKVFLNGFFGYYSKNGEKLIGPEININFKQLEFIKLDSLIKHDAYQPNWNELFFGQIVCKNESVKKLNLYYDSRSVSEIDMSIKKAITPEEFDFVEKGEFSIADRGNVKLLSGEWYEDLLLFDVSLIQYKLTDLTTQLSFNLNFEIDSVKVKENNHKLDFYQRFSRYDEYENKYFLDYYFAKKQGRWFLTNLNSISIPDNSIGFDSVFVNEKNSFKGYLNGKFSYYSFNNKSFQNPEIELEYPKNGSYSHIVCKNCIYETKKYLKLDTIEQLDINGNYMGLNYRKYTLEVPFVKKGEFNILNENKELVLTKWVNEIRVPIPEINQNFSITDSTSFVYNPYYDQREIGGPLFKEYNKSIALKYGSTWRLTTIQNQDVFIDGFEDVKFNGDYWEAKKEGKIYYYKVDGLKLKE